jgi:hypothetical protein
MAEYETGGEWLQLISINWQSKCSSTLFIITMIQCQRGCH